MVGNTVVAPKRSVFGNESHMLTLFCGVSAADFLLVEPIVSQKKRFVKQIKHIFSIFFSNCIQKKATISLLFGQNSKSPRQSRTPPAFLARAT